MLYESIIVRYGEMFLKAGNLPYFENKLLQNVKALTGTTAIIKTRGRLILPYFSGHSRLRRVFGISSYSPAYRAGKNLEAIQRAVTTLLGGKSATTFKIETTRSDKTFPLESREVNRKVGEHIEETTAWKCDFHNPQLWVKIEINQKGAYIFTEVIPGLGGLPVGTAGKVPVLIENDTDILAGILMMKRGCEVIPLVIGKENSISLLQQFSPKKIEIIRFENEPELQQHLREHNFPLLVTGENLEQKKEYPAGIMVLRPLVGYAGEEIKREQKRFQQAAG